MIKIITNIFSIYRQESQEFIPTSSQKHKKFNKFWIWQRIVSIRMDDDSPQTIPDTRSIPAQPSPKNQSLDTKTRKKRQSRSRSRTPHHARRKPSPGSLAKLCKYDPNRVSRSKVYLVSTPKKIHKSLYEDISEVVKDDSNVEILENTTGHHWELIGKKEKLTHSYRECNHAS